MRVKYWEIIADNLSKAGWSWDVSPAWIPTGERLRYGEQTGVSSHFSESRSAKRS
jgi:hypothetical protein